MQIYLWGTFLYFFLLIKKIWPAWGSNPRPPRYQHGALTNWANGPLGAEQQPTHKRKKQNNPHDRDLSQLLNASRGSGGGGGVFQGSNYSAVWRIHTSAPLSAATWRLCYARLNARHSQWMKDESSDALQCHQKASYDGWFFINKRGAHWSKSSPGAKLNWPSGLGPNRG